MPPVRRRLVAGLVVVGLVAGGCSGDDNGTEAPAAAAGDEGEDAPEDVGPEIAGLLGQERSLAIAHAGGERDYPKETLFAFGEAVRVGVDVLELDVHLSADGEIVAIHDDTVGGTTGGTGKVADMTADELAALDAAYWFVTGCGTCHDEPGDRYSYRGVRDGDRPPPNGYEAADFGVTTLAAISTRFPSVALDIEIKPSGAAGVATAGALAAELEALGRTKSSVVVSFDQPVVEAFRQAAPDVAVSPGVDGTTEWFLQQASLDGYSVLQVPPTYEGVDVVTAETVARAHDEGLDVWVWMNDASQETPEFYAEMFAIGVDGIIGDHPQVLADLVAPP